MKWGKDMTELRYNDLAFKKDLLRKIMILMKARLNLNISIV